MRGVERGVERPVGPARQTSGELEQGLRELSESESESPPLFALFVVSELSPSSCPSSSCNSAFVKNLPVHSSAEDAVRSIASVKLSDGDGVRSSFFLLCASSSLPVRRSAEDAGRFIASVVRREIRTELDGAGIRDKMARKETTGPCGRMNRPPGTNTRKHYIKIRPPGGQETGWQETQGKRENICKKGPATERSWEHLP